MNRMMTAAIIVSLASAPAFASITITQGASAPTYSMTLDFDEPGTPTGVVAPDAFLPDGITELQAGDGIPFVGDMNSFFPWFDPAEGNSFYGNFGIFIKFEDDLTEFSGDFWDPSGAPSPFGGGFGVFLFNDNGVDPIATYFGEPAWGGLGDTAINITTDGGMVFDEVRVLGFGFNPTTLGDNFSWNVVPEPTSLVVLALGSFAALRRRR